MDIIIDTANSAPNIVRNVKTISLVLADGKTITLPITPSLTLRAQDNKKTIEHSVNAIFANSGSYYEKGELIDLVAGTLAIHNLDSIDGTNISNTLGALMTGNPKSGGLRGYPVGNGLYLVCLWYQMPSGKYELTAYLS